MRSWLQKEWKTLPVFAGFFVIMLLQFHTVWIYYDDYGYYTLTYGINSAHVGHEYTFAQLLAYLQEHYSLANGRLFQFFVWLSLFRIGGLGLVQFAAACTVTAILYLLYTLTKDSKLPGVLRAAILWGGMFCIPIEIHRHGTYWFAAFFHYCLPLVTLTLFARLYAEKERQPGPAAQVAMGLLVLLTSWSMESMAMACVAMTGILFLIRTVREKKFALQEAFYTLCAALGTAALLLSPAILRRAKDTAGDVDLLHRVKNSVTMVFFTFYTDSMNFFATVLTLSAAVIAFCMYRKYGKKPDLINALVLVPVALILAIKPVLLHDAIVLHIAGLALSILIAFFTVLPAFRYYILSRQYAKAIVFGTGVLSVVVLAGVPSFPERVFIAFLFCSFVVICDAFALAYETLAGQKKALATAVIALVFLAFFLPSSMNFAKIYGGYSANNIINRENDRILREASERIRAGEEITEIHLQQFAEENAMYCTIMLYEQPGNWYMGMIQDYYRIPHQVELIYE